MLPVCSAAGCSSHSQVLLNHGLRYLARSQKMFGVQCLSGDATISRLSSGVYLQKEAVNSLNNDFVGGQKTLSYEWRYTTGNISDPFLKGGGHLTYVEESAAVDGADLLLESPSNEATSIIDNVAESTSNVLDNIGTSPESLPPTGSNFQDIFLQTNESLKATIGKGENTLNSSVDQITSTVTGIIKDGNEALENLNIKVSSSFDQALEAAKIKLYSLPGGLQQSGGKAGVIALDLLRKTIIIVEDSIVKGSRFVYSSYETSKEFLPSEIQSGLKFFEGKASEISRPVGMVFLQVYSVVEGLERSLGLDPSDPLAPFVLLLGTTSTIWAVYWLVTYSGYAGDLSPESAFELLSGKDSAVLVDVRPEDLRERDGIPDLRRGARFRYADVSLPKVDGSLRKLVKNSRNLDDALIAAVIRDLKNVQDRSKIIVMDADGSHAKGIARSLRKLGVKRPYVLHGGFKSWVRNGLRAKELKPETAITVLNEEAEAILEELKPTPVQVLGIAVGSVAALYALSEWEKTLQYIAVLGLVQTIYRRVASYEGPEDIRKDVSLLLSPVQLGAAAVKQISRKVEANGNGLPVSPSSSDVQSRVLQAVAKHESQPFDAEDSSQNSVPGSTTTGDENVGGTDA